MQLPDNWAGKQGRCPQCGEVLQIPVSSSKAAGSAAVRRPAAESQDATHTPIDSGIDLTDTQPGGPGQGSRSSRSMWFAAVAAGLALATIGLFLVFRGNGWETPHPDPVAESPRPHNRIVPQPDEPKGTVFIPQVKDAASTPNADTRPQPVVKPPEVDQVPKAAATPKTPNKLTPTLALADFGISVPRNASMIEIDGIPLPIHNLAQLTAERAVVVALPMGKHVVRFSPGDSFQMVEAGRWFIDSYREAAGLVQVGGRWDFDRLLGLSRQALDRFTEPFVPHLWGNYYWQEGEYAAAARHYAWALEIAPGFAPSYFNLAALHERGGSGDVARRYLRLAELWNAQNAYGLGQALGALRAVLGDAQPDTSDNELDWYTPERGELSARDRDMIAVLHSTAQFAPRHAERAKILNNLGAYFEYVGKPELAMQSYRSAAATLGSPTLSPEERRVVQGILENLMRLCRNANMPEYKRYERLQAMLR